MAYSSAPILKPLDSPYYSQVYIISCFLLLWDSGHFCCFVWYLYCFFCFETIPTGVQGLHLARGSEITAGGFDDSNSAENLTEDSQMKGKWLISLHALSLWPFLYSLGTIISCTHGLILLHSGDHSSLGWRNILGALLKTSTMYSASLPMCYFFCPNVADFSSLFPYQ